VRPIRRAFARRGLGCARPGADEDIGPRSQGSADRFDSEDLCSVHDQARRASDDEVYTHVSAEDDDIAGFDGNRYMVAFGIEPACAGGDDHASIGCFRRCAGADVRPRLLRRIVESSNDDLIAERDDIHAFTWTSSAQIDSADAVPVRRRFLPVYARGGALGCAELHVASRTTPRFFAFA
jgi:hypothetical protein